MKFIIGFALGALFIYAAAMADIQHPNQKLKEQICTQDGGTEK